MLKLFPLVILTAAVISVSSFLPNASAQSLNPDLSEPITINVTARDISNYMPFRAPGSYLDYKEITGAPISPTRFRFDYEKTANLCASSSLAVLRMSQTNMSGQPDRYMKFAGTLRFMLEWVGNHLHSAGIKNYYSPDDVYSSDPQTPRGLTKSFRELRTFNQGGYTSSNLPSFYFMPKFLDLNFFADGPFQRSDANSCGNFHNSYQWAVDYKILDNTDLSLGAGAGNLQADDLQIRFIEHGTDELGQSIVNREDWFLRNNVGVIRIESSLNRFSESCVTSQHSNYSCWKDPNLSSSAPCNCWSRRIHPTNMTDGFELKQAHTPRKLDIVFAENNGKTLNLKPGEYYTLKETGQYTGFLNLYESGTPAQIWKASTCPGYSCTASSTPKEVWMEDGVARILVPSNTPLGTYSARFRAHIHSQTSADASAGSETTNEPAYPAWADTLTFNVATDTAPTLTPTPTQSMCSFSSRTMYYNPTTGVLTESITRGPTYYNRGNNPGWTKGDLASTDFYRLDVNAPCYGQAPGACTFTTRTLFFDVNNKLTDTITSGPNYYNWTNGTGWWNVNHDLASVARYKANPDAPCYGKAAGQCVFNARYIYVEKGTNRYIEGITVGPNHYIWYSNIADNSGWARFTDHDLTSFSYYKQNQYAPCYGKARGTCIFDTNWRFYDGTDTLIESNTLKNLYYNYSYNATGWWPVANNDLGQTGRFLETNGPCAN